MTSCKLTRGLTAAIGSVVLLIGCALASEAQEAHLSYQLDIPAQSLDDALQTLALASNYKLLYPSSTVAGKQSPALKGEFTVEQAVQRLLSGTGLIYEINGSSVVLIKDRSEMPTAQREPVQEGGAMRLAQAAAADTLMNEAEEQGAQRGSVAVEHSERLEEIVVTAQKRTEDLQDVPISISVISGESLDRSGVAGVVDALARIPGVSVFQGDGNTTVTVRGVAANFAIFNGSSPTGYYVDSIPFGFVKSAVVPNPNAFDLQRVEVLKGPQGTLYGANSINGVVRILTQDADLNDLDVKAITSYSTTEGGADGYRGDAAINVPMIKGKLGARLVAGYNHIGGWIEKADNSHANDIDIANVRLKFKAQPTEDFSIAASIWQSRTDRNAPSVADNQDRSPRLLDESQNEDFDAYGLTLNYDLTAFSISSTSSYLDYRYVAPYDLEFNPYFISSDLQSEVFAQEVLLNSASTGPWVWSLGGFYRDAKDVPYQDVLPYDGPFGRLLSAPFDYDNTSRSIAMFGQLTRRVLDDRIELTGGLRYFRDKVGQKENIPADPSRPLAEPTETTFDAWTPRLAIGFHPTERHMAYASYSQGFRSGSPVDPVTRDADPTFPDAKPDKLYNYEIGSKGSLIDGRLGYEVAVYYVEWKDVQQAAGVPWQGQIISDVYNVGNASGPGIDVALIARPVDRLNLAAAFSYNGLEVDQDIFSNNVPTFRKGSRLANSPEYTAGLSVDYTLLLGESGYRAQFSAGANYTSSNGANVVLGLDRQSTPGEEVLIARGGLKVIAPRNWEVMLFSENLTNERATVDFDVDGATRLRRTPPRTFGLQLEYHFD